MKTNKINLLILGAVAFFNQSFAQVSSEPSKLPVSVSVELLNPTCSNSEDGHVKIIFTGGIPPYKVNNISIPGNEYLLSALGAGQYDFNLADEGVYQSTTTVNVTAPDAITIDSDIINNTNFNGNTGAIDITTNAVSPTFLWTASNDQVLDDPSNEDQFNLGAGNYQVVITDAFGCSASEEFQITQPGKPIVNDVNISSLFAGSNLPVVYPNPSNGKIDIISEYNQGVVTIVSEIGMIISKTNIDQVKQISLKPGKYTVHMELDNGTKSSEQLIVQ